MRRSTTSRLQRALDEVEKLSLEDQEMLLNLVRHRLVERRRAEISHNAAATLQAVREGHAHYGGIDDLKNDLMSDS